MLISNMTILFSNSKTTIPKSNIFGSKFKDFYFCTKLCNKTNSRTLISNTIKMFSNSSAKIRKSGIFGPKFRYFSLFSRFFIFFSRFLLLHQILQQGKFEDADFKYDNSIFKFHLNNTQIRYFWSQI